ncbi:MAG: hypothetical protein JXA71_13800 [Chitinispirillaceae bacterium]|nr:hypothetical protein [Chitinispirillaceae bacterium]
MTHQMLALTIVISAVLSLNGEPLFYTDFRTTPEGFAAASLAATALNGDDTLVVNPAPSTDPKDTVIDGCTLSANKSSTTNTVIVISKASQSYVKAGDTAGCTAGRLGLKQTGNSIKFPSVTGPCTITYYAAGSSAAGKAITFLVNGVSVPEAGFADLAIEGVQSTRKMVYSSSEEGPTEFTIIGNGGVYLYDVKIEAGMSGVIRNRSVKSQKSIWTRDHLVINTHNADIAFYSIAGKKILSSDRAMISVSALPKGIYVARVGATGEKIKIVR